MSYFNSPSIDSILYSDDNTVDLSEIQSAMDEHFRNADFRRHQRRRLSSPVTPVSKRAGGVSPLRSHPPEMPSPRRNMMSIAVPAVRRMPTRTSSTSSTSSVPSLVSSSIPSTPATPPSTLVSPALTDDSSISSLSLKDHPFSPVTPYFPLHTNCNCPTASMYVVDLPVRSNKSKNKRGSHAFTLNLNLNRKLSTLIRKASKSTLSSSSSSSSSPPPTPTKSKMTTPSLLPSSVSSTSLSASELSLTEDLTMGHEREHEDFPMISPTDLIKTYETGHAKGWASLKSPPPSPAVMFSLPLSPSRPVMILDDDDVDQSIRMQLQELELCYVELQEGRKRMSLTNGRA